MKYNVWASTAECNQKLHCAYTESNGAPIFLFFSVNGSGRFVGVARMASEVDFETELPYWNVRRKWMGSFELEWVLVKDVPNAKLGWLKYNGDTSVVRARNGQEMPRELGIRIMGILIKHNTRRSIMQEFVYYDALEFHDFITILN
eukprot:TRINITY_DN3193_c0_g1_i1.p2 TRINITY_DN3193_c0_g1~~TRINITY_DN3193_c0_g1_i1.p2  ORF type:complete len:146 (-),score=51.21 TRINITY_DN3193_c0_g1_i1:175-612(-)